MFCNSNKFYIASLAYFGLNDARMSAFDNLEGKYKFNFWMVFGRTAHSVLWHSAIWNAGAKNWDAARCCDAPYWSGLGGLLGVRCAEKSPRISSVATWTSKWLMGIREWYVLKNLQGKPEFFSNGFFPPNPLRSRISSIYLEEI